MNTGQVISGVGHLGLIGWLLFGGQFRAEPLPFEVTDVAMISGEEFDAMMAASRGPETATEVALPTPPAEEETQAPQVETEPDAPPEQVEPEVTETPPPETVPEQPEPPAPAPTPEEAVEAPPEITPPPVEEPRPAPEVSERPQARPVERVTPEPVAPPPEPEAQPDEVVREETQDTPAEEAQPEEEATAPEESVTEIVPEAADAVSAAPKTSVRPKTRPSRPAPRPAEEPEVADTGGASQSAIAAALEEANSETAESGGASSTGQGGPRLSPGDENGLISAISDEWVVDPGAPSASVTVVVRVQLSPEGRLAGSPELVSATGGDQTAINVAFRKARTALIAAGRKGFDLPRESYESWRVIEISFNPEKMRLQ